MSRYSKLLTKIIAESGYTAKEVAEKCNEIGNGLDVTRLSKLQNAKLPAPSEKVSRDIARICGADERKLVIEGYLEKAPKEIVDAFMIFKQASILPGLKIFENTLTKKQIEQIKKEIEKEPLSDTVIELLDNKDFEFIFTSFGFKYNSKDISVNYNDPIMFPVSDDSMYPILTKDSKVSLKAEAIENYNNGDILAIKVKDNEEILFRYVLFNDNKIILTSLNSKFKTLEYNLEDIIIMGKVSKIVTNI